MRTASASALALAFALCVAAAPALACGPDSDCIVGDRSYRLYLPETLREPAGALVWGHGYRGSAAGAMGNKGFRRMADDLGIAFIALNSKTGSWDLAHHPRTPLQTEAQEYDYVRAVMEDAVRRVDLDPSRVVATGFSSGGMLTWTLACGMSALFAGFVPVSGTFWAPVPSTCTTPVTSIVHIHGTKDKTVPLDGRAIDKAKQGDVPETLAMYATYGGFVPESSAAAPGGMTCETSYNPAGKILEFCTFEGGHSFSLERLRYGYDRVLGGG